VTHALALGTLSPSDLRRDVELDGNRDGSTAAPIRVGGRVIAVGEGEFTLADATSRVIVELTPEAAGDEVTEGDLVLVEGLWESPRLSRASVLERNRHPRPSGTSESARFAQTEVGRHVAARGKAMGAIRSLFSDARFLEVETPTWTPFPNLDPHLNPHPVDGGYLITSPEHAMKRMLSGGFPRIYQFAACTRDGERSPWHEPEFTLLEWYRAFAGIEDVIRDTETIVETVATAAGLANDATLRAPDGRVIPVRGPFRRVTVEELFAQHTDVADAIALAERDETAFFQLWVDRIDPAIGAFDEPVIVWKYPACQAALARRDPRDPRVAERFELYVGGVELCNGYGELTDASEQRTRFESFRAMRTGGHLEHAPLDEPLLAALEAGMPPSGGNALGIDRLVALARGTAGIQQVQAFPASRRR
jgi:elongation factor P--(R)-beta-lysine ligase